MIPEVRAQYNKNFKQADYEALVEMIHADYPNQLEFRIAETPAFVPKDLGNKIIEAGEKIIDVIVASDFKEKTKNAVPPDCLVPNENAHASFLALDYAVCKDAEGKLTPQLIELQGFPSIFGFQPYLGEAFRQVMDIPKNFTEYFDGYDREAYIGYFTEFLLGGHAPENVILLEIFPEKQKTRIDFALTQEYTGIKPVCLTKIQKEGKKLYYDNDGTRTEIKRIYHRLIFDELQQFPDLQTEFKLTDEVEVEWVGHPNWFFRISKYTLPFLHGNPYVPASYFLHELQEYPADLENYVLKPLFSFAGMGVKINITKEDLDSITDRENYLLQRKVQYEPVIESPTGGVKLEIRMLYTWEDGAERPRLITNLCRLSRGEMIGVRYNKDFDWVGGSICYFEM
jgi:hypothetical protein